tara:strand:+ start:441 stop:929 length:489 start_codon:yes stop_codon:yes gene_type:complete
MKTINKTLSSLIILSSLLLQSANGQAGHHQVNIEFTCISLDASIRKEKLYYLKNNRPINIRVNNLFHSPVYKYSGLNTLSFYTKGENGKHLLKGKANIDQNLKNACVFFYQESSENNSPKYKTIAFENSAEKYPAGSYRFYNLTKETVAIKIGEESIIALFV